MHKTETDLLLNRFQPEEIRRALTMINYELKLAPIKPTKVLAVVGFDETALKEYATRRYDLMLLLERLDLFEAGLHMRPVHRAVCASLRRTIEGYREKLLVLMTECEAVKRDGKNTQPLFEYLKRGEENARR